MKWGISITMLFLFTLSSYSNWDKTTAPEYNFWAATVTTNGNIIATLDFSRVFYSSDNGSTWCRSSIDSIYWFGNITNKDSIVLLCTNSGIFESRDYGVSFKKIGFDKLTILAVEIDNNNNYIAIVSNSGYNEAYISFNQGYSWNKQYAPYLGSCNKFIIEQNSDSSFILVESEYNTQNSVGRHSAAFINDKFEVISDIYSGTMIQSQFNNFFINKGKNELFLISDHVNSIVRVNIDTKIADTIRFENIKGFNSIQISNTNDIFLASSDIDGVFISSDNGLSWTELYQGLDQKKINTLFIDSLGSLYAATAQGIYKYQTPVSNVKIDRQKSINYYIKSSYDVIKVILLDNQVNSVYGFYNILGLSLENQISFNNNEVIIPKSNLSKGIYFCPIRTNNGIVLVKLIN